MKKGEIMKWISTLVISSFLLAASPFRAEAHAASSETILGSSQSMMLRFDQPQQKHPKKLTLAMLLTGPMAKENGDPLIFNVTYWTVFRNAEDPRNSKGRVILMLEIVRNDEVIWKKKKRSRVKYDRHTTNQCGNCTHKLGARFDGSLEAGDLVLMNFKFKKMPRFEPGEAASLGAEIDAHE